jgi:glycosyltransferase involved in cell wall biosynthesis
MRVLVNGLSARLGGGQTYLLNLLRRVPQHDGWKIFLLCPDSLDLTGLPENVERVESGLKLDNPFRRAIWERFNLGKLARRLGADLLFCPGGLLPPGSLPPGLKAAVTFQNMLPFDLEQRKRYPLGYRRLRDWLLERGLSSAMRKADLVIFISDFAQDFIQKKLGHLAGRVVVIPHGIDARFFPDVDKPLPLPTSVPIGEYFLYVSFIDHYKSQIEVVRAFAQVIQLSGAQASLLLVGAENPPYGEALRREINSLKLGDVVKVMGHLPHHDLPGLYQHARINLFASCTENCPNIQLEMMASGRPALVSDRGPMPEFGGQTVSYFDPENVEQLVERWVSLLSDPEQGNSLTSAAIDRVSTMQWERTASSTWGAMAEVVRARP